MATKTSQLQIRVTEAQKATLRRLAAAAGLSVSSYVLEQALPSRQRQLERALEGLSGAGREASGFGDVSALLQATPAEELRHVVGSPDRLPALMQNQLAALVEQAAAARAVDPPDWAERIPPLGRPHFAWGLASLRAHQIRVTPVALKRRGVFFDPATRPDLVIPRGRPPQEEASETRRRLVILDEALRTAELKVEFYFIGGAVLDQTFAARPPTAHISALFRPEAELLRIATEVGERQGWPPGWLPEAVRDQLGKGPRNRWVELGNLAVFAPPLEYVLALSVARLRLGPDGRTVDDVRYLRRALDLASPEAILDVTGRYFARRQLPADVRETLERLLAA